MAIFLKINVVMKKKISIVVLILFVLCSLSAVSTTWFYDTLNSKQKDLYNRIGEAILKTEKKLTNVDFDSSECLRIFSGYLDDHPGIFWVEPKISYGTYLDDSTVKHSIEFIYSHTDTLQQDKITFVSMVSKFSRYLQTDANDWLKLYHIYDYLASNIEYSLDYMDQSMWSVFFSGIGVCAGFARSFQYLALLEGIPAVVVHGYAKNEDGTISDVLHLWVMAQIEEKWYHFDPTWGLDDSNGNVDFSYFCRSQQRIELTHYIDNDYPIPQSGDDSLSYARMRRRYLSTYSRNDYKKVLLAAVANGEYSFTVEFSNGKEFQKAVEDLYINKGIAQIVKEENMKITSYSIGMDKLAYSFRLTLKPN